MKKIIVVFLISIMTLTATGCALEESGATLTEETVGIIGQDAAIETQENEMTELKTKHEIYFKDLKLTFNPIYSIESSRAENWMFTQSSSINLTLGIENVPEGLDVMVSQIYGDISLLSAYAKYNGIRQDSLNIEYYSLPTGGISIREADSYTIPFQVEAVDKSETFFYMYNGYGSSSTYRITESTLADDVQGAVLNVVWTVLIKEGDTGKVFVKTISDRVGIPYERAVTNEDE